MLGAVHPMFIRSAARLRRHGLLEQHWTHAWCVHRAHHEHCLVCDSVREQLLCHKICICQQIAYAADMYIGFVFNLHHASIMSKVRGSELNSPVAQQRQERFFSQAARSQTGVNDYMHVVKYFRRSHSDTCRMQALITQESATKCQSARNKAVHRTRRQGWEFFDTTRGCQPRVRSEAIFCVGHSDRPCSDETQAIWNDLDTIGCVEAAN